MTPITTTPPIHNYSGDPTAIYNTEANNDSHEIHSDEMDSNAITLPSGKKIPFEFLLQYICYSLIETFSKDLEQQEVSLRKEREFNALHEKERTTEVDTILETTKKLQMTGKVHKTGSAISLALNGIMSAFRGQMLLGTMSLVSGSLLALDRYLDDALSQKVASWIAQGDTEAESSWLDRIHLFSTVASLGFSYGVSGTTAVTIAQQTASLGLTGFEGYVRVQQNQHTGNLIGLDLACESSEQKIKNYIKILEQLSEMIQRMNTQKIENVQNHSGMIQGICQGIRV